MKEAPKLRRRDLLLGAPLLAAAAGAFALTPRNRLSLLGDKKLEDGIPLSIGPWRVTPSNAVILPEAEEGTLAARLYDQTVSRLYTSDTEVPVMLVVAYGSTQSDQLQLHRPETCYTAIGFEITTAQRIDSSPITWNIAVITLRSRYWVCTPVISPWCGPR